MLSVPDAFTKFRHRLEITPTEQADASKRQRSLRDLLAAKLEVDRDFLTGSYIRDTKTKPLQDVDLFVTFKDVSTSDEARSVLERVERVLVDEYGASRVRLDPPAVRVDFGPENAGAEDKVLSIDVVPAVATDNHYMIPNPAQTGWMATDPTVHATLATDANKAFDGHWKPMIKMIKKWNDELGEPIVPSFLIEVMGLKVIHGGWTGGYPYELKAYFASAAERIGDVWPDPAELGSPVSELLAVDPLLLTQARTALRDAEYRCGEAIRLDRDGKGGAALDAWQALFGPYFAKS